MQYREKKRTQISIRVLQVAVIVLGLIILGRLFQLQIIEYDTYGPLSRQNSLRQEIVNPARGLIYDRNGKLLVENEPIYSITITPANYDPKNTPLLAKIMELPVEKVRDKVQEARSYSWYRSSRLFTEVDFKKFSDIEENIWQLPGIGHQIESKRHYPVDSLKAAHIFGYLREVSKKKYLETENYHLGDKVGKSGLEMAYEKLLRGEKGIQYIKVNAMGQNLGSYESGSIDEAPQKGANLHTTLDTKLQLLAEDLMKGKRGAAVALDPGDGSILCMASAPQYDVRKLSGRLDIDYWKSINADTARPLYNRAISSKQPPGSTFKPLMALMGLGMGIITPQTTVYNPGYYYRGRRYHDHADKGTYNLVKAIQNSSNTYFFSLMDKIASGGRLNRWHDMAVDFGMGVKTGVDLPYESSGIMPDSSYLNKVLGKGTWGIGDQLSLGVGQGFMSVSPLQVARMTAQIANGGYRIRPHLVNSIKKSDGTVMFTNTKKKKIDWVSDHAIDVVKEGMRRVVTKGTGRWYADLDSVKVAGKTGTAQNPHGQDHGWFICFAPLEDPQIAVAVLVENGGYGSISAAPIASLLVEQYITGAINRPYVYKYVKEFEPRKQ